MYIDVRGMSNEEKVKMKRQLTMQQVSFESDLKKVKRKQLELKDNLSRFKKDRDRIDVYIKDNNLENKKAIEKELFMLDEIKQIKKKLIELG